MKKKIVSKRWKIDEIDKTDKSDELPLDNKCFQSNDKTVDKLLEMKIRRQFSLEILDGRNSQVFK